jgi:hypothetical protein
MFWFQRRTRGWDDSETWSLDSTIAKFVLPRIQRFRQLPKGHPGDISEEEWDNILGEIEWVMSVHASEDGTWNLKLKKDWKRYRRGMRLFGEYFGSLWS